jgi:hypothetical protein
MNILAPQPKDKLVPPSCISNELTVDKLVEGHGKDKEPTIGKSVLPSSGNMSNSQQPELVTQKDITKSLVTEQQSAAITFVNNNQVPSLKISDVSGQQQQLHKIKIKKRRTKGKASSRSRTSKKNVAILSLQQRMMLKKNKDVLEDGGLDTEYNEEEEFEISFDQLPDELIISIFRYLPVVDLARSARVCRRFAILWVQGAHTVEVKGKLRRMKEDEFVQVVRKFVRLESLDLCNDGSSEDFQVTDKGLLQLAHKYIYSNADYLAVPKDDPLSGNYDFNFDYESHLDSLDELTGSFTGDTVYEDSDLDTQNDSMIDEDEFSSESTISSYTSLSDITQANRRLAHFSTNAGLPITQFRKNGNNLYNLQYYAHIYYVYPPPRAVDQKQNHPRTSSGEPHYGLHTLRSINLLGCHNVTENGIKYLTFFCQNLRDLNLKGCTKVNDNALSYLAQFEHLVNLDLTGCVHISDLGLRHLSNSKAKKNLKFLDLTFCHKITDEGLQWLSQLTALETLNLQCCRFVTNKGLSHVINACRDLKTLNLTGCDKATLSGIDAPRGLVHLEKLAMMGCKLTSDSCMNNLISWTSNLKELVLAFSDHVTDKGIKSVVEGCKQLRYLNLKRCDNITDLSLEYISANLCDTLQHLNLTGCRKFTNRGLGFLTTLHNLEELLLRKCYQIDHRGLDYVAMCVSLRKLDISECNKITDEPLKRLCRTLCNIDHKEQDINNTTKKNSIPIAGLRELMVEKCPLVSKDTLDGLRVSYPHVIFTM